VQFTQDLEAAAFHTRGGEYAWRRADALRAACALGDAGIAILGGELWLIRGAEVLGLLPQHSGPAAVYHWECERKPAESWSEFVARACSESVSAIEALPPDGEVNAPAGAEIYYNLTWVSEHE
jgi:hypothetical protein